MILAIFNCLTIPLSVSFDPAFMRQSIFTAINYLIDFLFLADLVINCRTTFINSKTGEEIKTPKAIFCEQLKGRFWIDFLASLPLDEMSQVISTHLFY